MSPPTQAATSVVRLGEHDSATTARSAPAPLTLRGGGWAYAVLEDADGAAHVVQAPMKGELFDEVVVAPDGAQTVVPMLSSLPLVPIALPDDVVQASLFPGGGALLAFVDRSGTQPHVVVRMRAGGAWSASVVLSNASRDAELVEAETSPSGAAAVAFRERRGRSWIVKLALRPVGASQFRPAVTIPTWSDVLSRGFAVRYDAPGDGVLVFGASADRAARPAAAVARISRDGTLGPVIPLRRARGRGAPAAALCDDGTIVAAWYVARAGRKTVAYATSVASGSAIVRPATRLGPGSQKLLVGCSAGQAAIVTSFISGDPFAGREVMRLYSAAIGKPPTLRREFRAGMPTDVSLIPQPGGGFDFVWEAWYGSEAQAAYLLRGRADDWTAAPQRIATSSDELSIDAIAPRPAGGVIAAISLLEASGEKVLQLVRTDP